MTLCTPPPPDSLLVWNGGHYERPLCMNSIAHDSVLFKRPSQISGHKRHNFTIDLALKLEHFCNAPLTSKALSEGKIAYCSVCRMDLV